MTRLQGAEWWSAELGPLLQPRWQMYLVSGLAKCRLWYRRRFLKAERPGELYKPAWRRTVSPYYMLLTSRTDGERPMELVLCADDSPCTWKRYCLIFQNNVNVLQLSQRLREIKFVELEMHNNLSQHYLGRQGSYDFELRIQVKAMVFPESCEVLHHLQRHILSPYPVQPFRG